MFGQTPLNFHRLAGFLPVQLVQQQHSHQFGLPARHCIAHRGTGPQIDYNNGRNTSTSPTVVRPGCDRRSASSRQLRSVRYSTVHRCHKEQQRLECQTRRSINKNIPDSRTHRPSKATPTTAEIVGSGGERRERTSSCLENITRGSSRRKRRGGSLRRLESNPWNTCRDGIARRLRSR